MTYTPHLLLVPLYYCIVIVGIDCKYKNEINRFRFFFSSNIKIARYFILLYTLSLYVTYQK